MQKKIQPVSNAYASNIMGLIPTEDTVRMYYYFSLNITKLVCTALGTLVCKYGTYKSIIFSNLCYY